MVGSRRILAGTNARFPSAVQPTDSKGSLAPAFRLAHRTDAGPGGHLASWPSRGWRSLSTWLGPSRWARPSHENPDDTIPCGRPTPMTWGAYLTAPARR